MISKDDFLSKLEEAGWKDGTLEEGDLVAIWIAGVCVYAMCMAIDDTEVEFWYAVKFVVFDRVPPYETTWRLHWDHLNMNEFTMNGAPVIIVPLTVRVSFDLPDLDDIKKTDWDEFLGEE